jgi:hypothetical protein
MTTLMCQTLRTELIQEINYSSIERLHIGAFIPYLYVHNNPTGNFNLELSGANGVVFSKSFTSQDIKDSLSTTDNFMHVNYPVVPQNPVQIEKGDYTVRLSASGGYMANANGFIAWIQRHEDMQNEMSYIPSNDEENSFSIRFKSFKEGINV